MRWPRVVLVLAFGGLAVVGLAYILRPFSTAVGVSGPGWTASQADEQSSLAAVSGSCRAALFSAPGRGEDQLHLWAVTVGAEMGSTPVFGDDSRLVVLDEGAKDQHFADGVCAHRARDRLATGVIFLALSATALVITLRRPRRLGAAVYA